MRSGDSVGSFVQIVARPACEAKSREINYPRDDPVGCSGLQVDWNTIWFLELRLQRLDAFKGHVTPGNEIIDET